MYYFDEYQLYDPQHLSKAYRELAGEVRSTKAGLFPVYLTSWIMALLCGCFSAIYNVFFYCGYDQAAASKFPVPVVSDILEILGGYIHGNFFLMFLGGFVFVSLVPLAIGLVIRLVMNLVLRLFIRLPSQEDMSAQERLQQMRKFCSVINKKHDFSLALLIFPLIAVFGTAAGIMYAMYLNDPTVLDSSVIEWIIAIVLMVLFGVLLCLLHGIYFLLNFIFFTPMDRSNQAILQAIDAEEDRLKLEQDAEVYYNNLRAELQQQEETKKKAEEKAEAEQIKKAAAMARSTPQYQQYREEARVKHGGAPSSHSTSTGLTDKDHDDLDAIAKAMRASGTIPDIDYSEDV